MLRGVGNKLGNEQRDADGPVSAHEQFGGSVTGNVAVWSGLGEIATYESEIFAKFDFLDLRAPIQSVMGARYRGDTARRFLQALAQRWVVFARLQGQHAGNQLQAVLHAMVDF